MLLLGWRPSPTRLEAMAIRLEAIAIFRLEAIAIIRPQAIAIKLEAIAVIRLEAMCCDGLILKSWSSRRLQSSDLRMEIISEPYCHTRDPLTFGSDRLHAISRCSADAVSPKESFWLVSLESCCWHWFGSKE